MFSAQFDGIVPSSIYKEGRNLIVSYNVPLRQHAAKVTFTMDIHKPDSPIQMRVHIFGGDEADRFKRTAVLASLFAHMIPDTKFVNGVPPQIDYLETNEVAFELEFLKKDLNFEEVFKRMRIMIKDNTMVDDPAMEKGDVMRSAPERYEELVVRDLSGTQFGDYFSLKTLSDWRKVPEQFFADSLYLNLYLLERFTQENDFEMAERIARKSLEGLDQYGIDDYTGKGISKEEEMYYSKYTTPRSASLREGIRACLSVLQEKITAELALSGTLEREQQLLGYQHRLTALSSG